MFQHYLKCRKGVEAKRSISDGFHDNYRPKPIKMHRKKLGFTMESITCSKYQIAKKGLISAE